MRRLRSYLLIASVGLASTGSAQQFLGVATDGWSGMNTLYLNPANIAGREERISINLISVGESVDNSNGTFGKPGDLFDANNNGKFYKLYSNLGSGPFSAISPAAIIRGPGVQLSLNNKHSIAVTTGIQAINQFNEFDAGLYNSITGQAPTSGTVTYSTKNFNWTKHAWSELGVSYAVVLIPPGAHQLNAGITLRYLQGIGYESLRGYNVKMDYKQGVDSIYAYESDLEYASNIPNGSGIAARNVDASNLMSKYMTNGGGAGFSGDIGLTYFYRPEKVSKDDEWSGNGYRVRVSASVTNWGFITYKADNNYVVNGKGHGYITGDGLLNNTRDYADFRQYALQHGFRVDTVSTDTKVTLPGTFIFNADFQIYKRAYLSTVYVANIMDRYQHGNSYYDKFTLIPRYDSRLIGVGLPVTYSMLAHDVKLGLGVRVAGFFFGSDDMMALFSDGQHGFGFYAGLYVPIYKKKEKHTIKSR